MQSLLIVAEPKSHHFYRYVELSKKEEESFYRDNIQMKEVLDQRLKEFGTIGKFSCSKYTFRTVFEGKERT